MLRLSASPRLVLPGSRPTPNVFKGQKPPSETADALLAAVETSAVMPQEGALIAKGLLSTSHSDEWRDVAERGVAESTPAAASLRIVHPGRHGEGARASTYRGRGDEEVAPQRAPRISIHSFNP